MIQKTIEFGLIQKFSYNNYRGEKSRRTVLPLRLEFGQSVYYTEPQWLLRCFDYDKNEERSFALNRIYVSE